MDDTKNKTAAPTQTLDTNSMRHWEAMRDARDSVAHALSRVLAARQCRLTGDDDSGECVVIPYWDSRPITKSLSTILKLLPEQPNSGAGIMEASTVAEPDGAVTL